jgi:hypothetical protein
MDSAINRAYTIVICTAFDRPSRFEYSTNVESPTTFGNRCRPCSYRYDTSLCVFGHFYPYVGHRHILSILATLHEANLSESARTGWNCTITGKRRTKGVG